LHRETKSAVLVTGGLGFIGRHLVSELSKNQNYDKILIIDRPKRNFQSFAKHPNVIITIHYDDIRNTEAISDILKCEGRNIQSCIHLAGQTEVAASSFGNSDNTFDVNISGTQSVLETCVRNNIKRFIFASSAATYGEAQRIPIDEDQELKPISPYGKSKVEAEKLVMTYVDSGKISCGISLRIFNVYGLGQNPEHAGVIANFAKRITKGMPPIIYGDGMQTRDFISVNDVVRAIMLALDANVCKGAFNVGTGKSITMRDLATKMIGMTKLNNNNIQPVYMQKPRITGDIRNSCADTKKAKYILKFTAREELDLALAAMIGRY
jgi:nucleoside-diphosphate-sugar epimerase